MPDIQGMPENLQQITELLNTTQTQGPAQTKRAPSPSSKDEIVKSKKEKAKSDGEYNAGSGKPVLLKPNTAIMERSSTNSDSAEIETTETAPPPDANAAEKIAYLKNKFPMTNLLMDARMNFYQQQGKTEAEAKKLAEPEVLEQLQQEFLDRGIFGELNLDHQAMPEVLTGFIEKELMMDHTLFPDEKAQVFNDAISMERTAVEYMTNVKAKTVNGPSLYDQSASEQAKTILNSYTELFEEMKTQTGKLIDEGKFGNAPLSMMEYLEYISKVISELKQLLVEIEMMEGGKKQEIARSKVETIEMKQEAMTEKFQKMQKMMRLEKLMKEGQKFMKIFSYVMMGSMIVFGLVFFPISPITTILAFMAGAALMALTVSLTETGQMEKIFSGLNFAIDEVVEFVFEEIFQMDGPPGGENLWRSITWTAIIATMLLTAAVGIVVVGPQLGAVASQVALTMIQTILSNAEVVEGIVKPILGAMGADENAVMITTLLLSTMLTATISLVFQIANFVGSIVQEIIKAILSGPSMLMKSIMKVVVEFLKTLMQTMKQGLKQLMKEVGKMIFEIIKLVLTAVKEVFSKLFNVMKEVLEGIQDASKEIVKGVKKLFHDFTGTLKDIMTKIKDTVKQFFKDLPDKIQAKIKDFLEKMMEDFKQMRQLKQIYSETVAGGTIFMQASGQSAQAYLNLVTAGIQDKQAEIREEQGELEQMIEILRAIIETLENFLNSLSTGGEPGSKEVGEFMKQANDLGELFKNILKGYSEAVSGVTDANV